MNTKIKSLKQMSGQALSIPVTVREPVRLTVYGQYSRTFIMPRTLTTYRKVHIS